MRTRKPGEPGLLRDGGAARTFKGRRARITKLPPLAVPYAGERTHELPEALAVESDHVHPDYLPWVEAQTRPDQTRRKD